MKFDDALRSSEERQDVESTIRLCLYRMTWLV